MEHIISFAQSSTKQQDIFEIEIAGITYPDKNYHIVRPNSLIYCFEYVIAGKGTVKIDDTAFYVEKGDVYILPRGKNHDYRADEKEPFEKIWFNVYGNLCTSVMQSYHMEGVYHIKGADLAILDDFKGFLSVCERRDLSVDEIFAQCSLLFHSIVQKLHLEATESYAEMDTAHLIREYIDKNIYKHLSLELISQYICLSPSQITRVFKKAFRTTPYRYIIEKKIDMAKLLLANTNLSVKEIAYLLHFADEHYFSNAFKKIEGVAPTVYQRNLLSQY